MNKIFKYKFDPATREVEMPKEAWILRIDYVDDGFYKGDFLWAMVDPESPSTRQQLDPFLVEAVKRANRASASGSRHELRVKEKQSLVVDGQLQGAGEEDGKIFVYGEPSGEPRVARIAVFKTGQAIDVPIDRLRYLGLNRLWIIQELGLYTFEIAP